MFTAFPHRLHGPCFVIATAQASAKPVYAACADARGRRWLDVQIRRRHDDRLLALDRALVDARGRVLAIRSPLGERAWADVDGRRIASAQHRRGRDALRAGQLQCPPEWHALAQSRGFSRVLEPKRLDFVGFASGGRPMFLTTKAAQAWRAMRAAAYAESISLESVSTFRSIAHQRALVERKLARGQSVDEVFAVNAVPGYSEHHSGRAIDIGTPGCPALDEAFEHSPAFAWLREHAARFGFHLSYPRGNAMGVIYEPWHWCFHTPGVG